MKYHFSLCFAASILILASVETSIAAAQPPMLDGPGSAFVAYYGEAKSADTPLGKVRMWKRGAFQITHIEGGTQPSSVSVVRKDGNEMSRREAFAIGTRYCGKQEWRLVSKDTESEVFTNEDGSFQLTYSTAPGKEKHVTIAHYPTPTGIDQL